MSTQPNSRRRVALTFEAGGDSDVCARLLDVMRDSGAKGTIFLDGSWAAANPQLVRRMAAEGHELGNHSYTHPDMTGLSDDAIRDELRRTDALALKLTGQAARPWFRPPFAALDARVRRIAIEEGYRLIMRDAVDGGHWPGATTTRRIVERSLHAAADGGVLTYHLNSPLTLEALPEIIKRLRGQNCELVTLSDLENVSERPQSHPDFADLAIEPGYLQVMQRGARVWSLNALAYGAWAQYPAGEWTALTPSDPSISLLCGTGIDWQPAASHDRHLVVVAGELEYQLRSPTADVVARAVGRPGDMLLWAAGYELRLTTPGEDNRRWIILCIE